MIKLDKDEKILLKVRKHWFVLFAESFFLLILILLPLFIIFAWKILYSNINISIAIGGDIFSLYMFLSSAWFLFLWIAFFVIWTNYYLDMLIVTNKRIIDIEQRSLFSREISMSNLNRIQDITAKVVGVIPTLLNYGDVYIQTAGEGREFIIKGMPNPYGIKDYIYKKNTELSASK